MIYKTKLIILFFLVFLNFNAAAVAEGAQEADQQIMDFSLAGFGEKGKKTWDIAGKSADISTDVIKLKDVVGNFYGQQEDVNLLADRGDFNKHEALLHLEDNVVITTSTGAKLTTDSLDWDRKKKFVSTNDLVNIEKENLTAVSSGATGNPDLNKMTLEKDVTVQITPAQDKNKKDEAPKDKIVIICDGPVQIDYAKNVAVFNNNVKVDKEDFQIYSDVMEVYFISKPKEEKEDSEALTSGIMGSSIDKIISRGNVKIIRGDNTSYSDEAVYNSADKKITLTGRPKLILYSAEEMNASFGD